MTYNQSNRQNKAINIFIADDHDLLLETLQAILEKGIPHAAIHTANSHNDLAALIKDIGKPDLLLLDYRMPELSGIAAFTKYRKEHKIDNIAIFSGSISHSDMNQCLEKGAMGFIPKTISPNAIVGAIMLMLAGEKYIPFMKDNEEFFSEELNEKDKQIVEKLKLGFSNKEIARDMGIEEVTVKTYIHRLCQKTNTKNRTHLVAEVIEQGLL